MAINKCKAISVKSGKVVYGFYFNVEFKDGSKKHFILEDGSDAAKDRTLAEVQVEVKGETVCQFTGKYDYVGNEVYDHDIVRDGWDRQMVIIYSEDHMAWKFEAISKTNFDEAWAWQWFSNDTPRISVYITGNSRFPTS